MAQPQLSFIDLSINDSLDVVVRKCNTNFKALLMQQYRQARVSDQTFEDRVVDAVDDNISYILMTPTAINTINGIINTDRLLPSGGTTGQGLTKTSDTDYDVGWTALGSKVFYGTSSTAANTQTKVVNCPEFKSSDLVAGTVLFCRFSSAQSFNGSPNLNINSTGSQAVSCVSTTALPRYWWKAGEMVAFVYEGTRWLVVKGGYATTTYYGPTKLSSSVTSTSESLAATPKAVKTAYDLAASAAPASSLATVATTGDYGDLINTPSIPSLAFTRVLSRNTAGEPDFVDLGISVASYNEIVVSDSADQKHFAKIAMPSSLVTYTLTGGNQFKAKLENDMLNLSLCPDASWNIYAR